MPSTPKFQRNAEKKKKKKKLEKGRKGNYYRMDKP